MTDRECIKSCFYRCTGHILPADFGISEIRTVQNKPDVRHVTAIITWGVSEFTVCYDAYVNRDGVVIACRPGCVDDNIRQTLKDYYNPPQDPEPEPDPDSDTGGDEQDEPKQEPEQIPCLTLSVFQIFLNIVNPIIDDFCDESDPEVETAKDIFREFFHGAGYQIKWLTDPEDGEITGAEMVDSNGTLLYSTNQEV